MSIEGMSLGLYVVLAVVAAHLSGLFIGYAFARYRAEGD